MDSFNLLLPFQANIVERVCSMMSTTELLSRASAMEKDIAGAERQQAKHFAGCPKGEDCRAFKAGSRELAAMRQEHAQLVAEIAKTMTDEN